MKITVQLIRSSFIICALLTGGAEASRRLSACSLDGIARNALSQDPAVSQRAIVALRAMGPTGLEAVLCAFSEDIQSIGAGPAPGAAAPAHRLRLREVLDAVSQQRDCSASKLYWFTDLDKAKAAARTEGKPILSLRLLGKLSDEFSCANSRFFRTVLYANAAVSAHLREKFILHWESVRPVPRIEIDFGDGRRIARTITGNSIHYVLDSEGRVVDALPGLYGPEAFLKQLALAAETAARTAALTPVERPRVLKEYHAARLARTLEEWSADLAKVGAPARPTGALVTAPTAKAAGELAVTKRTVERPMIRAVGLDRSQLAQTTDDALWSKIAALHAGESRLDDSSTALMRLKMPDAFDASRLALSKGFVETPLLRAVRNLERSTAEDTVRNEYLFHAAIHEWFAGGSAPADLKQLNDKVYAELFLTPGNDPWLGLVPADTYSALENGGVVRRQE